MSKGDIKSFCRSVLPQDFDQVSRVTGRCQKTLQSSLPDGVGNMVQVLTVHSNVVSVAANSPVVANYLRLHIDSLQKTLSSVVGPAVKIEIKTRPASLSQVALPDKPRQPKSVSPSTASRLSSSAESIEDDALRAAMQSLAKTLETSTRSKD